MGAILPRLQEPAWFMPALPACWLTEHYSLFKVSLFENNLIVCPQVKVSLTLSLSQQVLSQHLDFPVPSGPQYALPNVGIHFFPPELQ